MDDHPELAGRLAEVVWRGMTPTQKGVKESAAAERRASTTFPLAGLNNRPSHYMDELPGNKIGVSKRNAAKGLVRMTNE